MTFNKDEILNLFKDFDFSSGFDDSMIDNFAVYLFNKNLSFSYDFGTTKAVIIPKEKDYVIKIPFQGYYDCRDRFHFFERAEDLNNSWDYCKVEMDRYKKISNSSLKNCFAETIFLGYVNNYPIYIQERCLPFNNTNRKTKDERKTMQSYLEDRASWQTSLNPDWCIDFMRYYGKKHFEYFIVFIERFNWGDDLSWDNVGYKAGRPIVIDFAGYREKGEQDEILDTFL